jgi:LPXTG-motif cell wall-anchored protein
MSENPNSFDLNGPEAPPPSRPDNRGFILVVSILGGLFLLALLCMAGYVAVVLPKNRAQQSTQAAQINLANTSTVSALTQAATLAVKSPTPVPPTVTLTSTPTLKPTPTFTPVLAIATSTLAPAHESVDPRTATVSALLTQAAQAKLTGTSESVDPRTATVSALLTQAAQAKLTGTSLPTSTALPKTGFAEDLGIPSLLGLTVLLLAVIFVVRRLRASPSA